MDNMPMVTVLVGFVFKVVVIVVVIKLRHVSGERIVGGNDGRTVDQIGACAVYCHRVE